MLLVFVFYPRRIASNGLRSDLSSLGGVLNVEWILFRWNLLIHLHRLLSMGSSEYMASTEGLGTSSPDPWAGTEDEITAIRRRVRRLGQTLQKLDESEGNRLEETETRMSEKIDTLQARIHKVETEVRKLSEGHHRYKGDQMTTSKKKEGTVVVNYSYSGSGF
jgi:hypothetical protein